MVYVGADMPLVQSCLLILRTWIVFNSNTVCVLAVPSFYHQSGTRLSIHFPLVGTYCIDSLVWSYLLGQWSGVSSMSIAGFKATPANLLTVPVYVFACIATCIVGFLADRYGHRGAFNLYVNSLPSFQFGLTGLNVIGCLYVSVSAVTLWTEDQKTWGTFVFSKVLPDILFWSPRGTQLYLTLRCTLLLGSYLSSFSSLSH